MRQKRILQVISGFAAVLMVASTLVYGYVLGGWFTQKSLLDSHLEVIAPYFDLAMPEHADVASPVPVAILVPGCLGTHAFHREWAKTLREAGLATLIVDSYTPRGLVGLEAIAKVCEGARPWGFERAADVVAAVTHVQRIPQLDGRRVALIGWSHGGWAVMDALTFGPRSRPTNLECVPQTWSQGVRAVVLFYPYCGFGSRSATAGWPNPVPSLMYLAGDDENIPTDASLNTVRQLAEKGVSIEVRLQPKATHWFDNPEGFDLVPHRFDAEFSNAAKTEIRSFLLGLLVESDLENARDNDR